MSLGTVKLRLVNQTHGHSDSQFVILDKSQDPVVAWRVFEFAGTANVHEFDFSPLEINASDEYGNYTPLLPAAPGDAFRMVDTPSGNVLEACGDAGSPEVISMSNEIRGEVSACFYRDKKLFAERNRIRRGQKVDFRFGNGILVAQLNGILEGQQLRPAQADAIREEFSLAGIVSADIVVSGGEGKYEFRMVNVVRR